MDEYIRSGMHLQLNKIGRSELDKQKIIEHFKDDGEYQEIKDLNIVGLDLSVLQNQAIHGVQVLLDKTNYKGNHSPYKMNALPFGKIELPIIEFTPAEFYEACGLKKYETKKGWKQYRSGESEQVLKALKSLYNKEFVITYNEKTFSEKKNQFVSRHIKIYSKLFGDVKETSRTINGRERLESITMIMSHLFVAQLDTYNVQKPRDYIAQIKMIAPRASKFVHLFIEHVLNQSRLNKRGGVVKLKEETLAYQLRMDAYIKSEKWAEIRKVIKKCLETAEKMEFIHSKENHPLCGWSEAKGFAAWSTQCCFSRLSCCGNINHGVTMSRFRKLSKSIWYR